ncbi:MAG: haloacid dehalogenase type II [Haloarculaceae archaeon]
MAFEPARVEVVTFDSYSTLVDVGTTVEALADHVEDPISVARSWRVQSLIYAFACNALDAYEPFWDLCDYALDDALAEHGEDLSAAVRTDVLSVYHDLDSFPDVRPGVERLVDAGYDCYVVSNGNPEMLATMVESAGIADLIADTVSADDVASYKPAPAIYEEAARRAGAEPETVVHATAGLLDAQGATNAGLQSVWLNRHERARGRFGPDPGAERATVHDLADALGAP